MNILLTGGTGFVGKHVLKALPKEYNIALITRSGTNHNREKLNIINGSLTNIADIADEINSFNPDICIHMAWEGIPDFSYERCISNVEQSINFINVVSENSLCKKIIVTGSCNEYGNTPGVCRETDKTKINSYFAWAKQTIYEYYRLKCLENKINLYWLRCFYIYGSGQRKGSIIPSIVSAFLKNEKPMINNPYNANDYIHVSDIFNAINYLLTLNPESGIYNLGSGEATEVIKLCEIVEQNICNTNTFSDTLRLLKKQTDNKPFWADISKAKKMLKWEPRVNLSTGINELIDSLKVN